MLKNLFSDMKELLTPKAVMHAYTQDQIQKLFRSCSSHDEDYLIDGSSDESNYDQLFRQVSTLLTYLSFKHNQMFFMKKEAEYEGSLGYFKVYLGFIFIDDIVFEKEHCKMYFHNERHAQESLVELAMFCEKFYKVQEQSILKDIYNDFTVTDFEVLDILVKLSSNTGLREDITYLLENRHYSAFTTALISQGYDALKLAKLFSPDRTLSKVQSFKASDFYSATR